MTVRSTHPDFEQPHRGRKEHNMKRIKSINGYTIYEATTQRDADSYNCEIGNYNIYLSSDIRDFGLTNSYPEYDDVDSLSAAIAMCSGSRYAVACALAEEISGSTAQDMDLVLEIERRLEAGESLQEVAASFDVYDDADDVRTVVELELEPEDADDDIDDELCGDLEDVFAAAIEAGDRKVVKFECEYIKEYLPELISGVGSETTHDAIDNSGIWGVALLELPYADIEVNITHFDSDEDGAPIPDSIMAEYFVCLKAADGEWMSYGYLNREAQVDFSRPDWEQELKRDMYDTLCSFADEEGWDLSTPFTEAEAFGGEVFVEYAAELCPVEPEQQPVKRAAGHATYYVIGTDGDYWTKTVDFPLTADFEPMPADRRLRYFFRTVAKEIAFDDCGDYTVEEIVYDGQPCEYIGWRPGMEIAFRNTITGEIIFDECFPEWNH